MGDGNIYVGSNVRMRTLLDTDLSNATNIIYRWTKPKRDNPNEMEQVDYVCDIEDILNGIVYYDTQGDINDPAGSDLDVSGEYMQHVFVTYSDGKTVPSDLSFFQVKNLWEK